MIDNQNIRIRLKAFDHRVLDQSTKEIVSTAKRTTLMPDMPTLHESGLPDFEAIVWWGILAPAGTPAAIVSRLDREIKAVLAMPEIRKAFANQGVEPDYQDSAGFRAFIAREIASWKQVVEKANIKLQ